MKGLHRLKERPFRLTKVPLNPTVGTLRPIKSLPCQDALKQIYNLFTPEEDYFILTSAEVLVSELRDWEGRSRICPIGARLAEYPGGVRVKEIVTAIRVARQWKNSTPNEWKHLENISRGHVLCHNILYRVKTPNKNLFFAWSKICFWLKSSWGI